MAIDAFLDFRENPAVMQVKGESIDKMFPETFHVKTFTFSITQKGTAATGTGLGAGKSDFEDFEFTIDTQYGCAQLLKHCAKGTCFDLVILHVRKAGGKQYEYLQYAFGNCILSSYSTSGDEESADTIKFNYRAIAAKYYRQKGAKDGTAGLTDPGEGDIDESTPPSEGSYDLKQNVEWTQMVQKMKLRTEGIQ